jgi:MFS family permease
MSSSNNTNAIKFGPALLSEGISRTNALTYFVAAAVGICLVLCVNLLQPYILAEHLKIPRNEQGGITGMLGFLQEVIVIIAVIPFGWLADRIGRRPVFVTGFVLFGLGFLLYPLATSVAELYQFRILIAVGAAAYSIGLFSISADYPNNEYRGKWTMILTIVQGLTASIIAGPYLAKLPLLFTQRGIDPISAGEYAFWVFGGLALFTAIIMHFGLASPLVEKLLAKKSAEKNPSENNYTWRDMLTTGFAAARTNPRLALSYAGGFATRGDFAIITAFLMLWITQAGIQNGLATGQAMAKAGMLFGLSQLAATIWAAFFGPLMDRINRLTGFVIAMGIATVAYLHMFFIRDPLGAHMMIAVVLLGIAEMSTIIAGQVLITQEAPAPQRGRIVGLFSLFGAAGIMVGTGVGGFLFDYWMPAAPYVFMGVINAMVFAWALRLRLKN